MSRSNDAGHFFQTTEALATTERKAAKAKNKHGNPIKLPSKLLAAIDASNGAKAIYVAEAAGDAKRVDLDVGELALRKSVAFANTLHQTSQIERVFSEGTAPLTCLAICPITNTLFTGSWDKNIYAVSLQEGGPSRKLSGHTDFVKCLLVSSLNGSPVLVSGSADASIIVWDISADNFGKQLHKLKGHTKALQDLALDPLSLPPDATAPKDSLVVFSASSDREIRRWSISRENAHELPESIESPIRTHDTSVYRLIWDSEGDLWTASADKTSRHLVRSREWEADTVLQHPDFVRDVALFEQLGLVVTACRDEDVRVWNASSGKLVCSFQGHYEEVTQLVALDQSTVASVSIDGTVRKWNLESSEIAKYQEMLAKEAAGEVEEAPTSGSVLTAEEEAELAELMDDDD